jgi:predicted PurR-regulated permease PerM
MPDSTPPAAAPQVSADAVVTTAPGPRLSGIQPEHVYKVVLLAFLMALLFRFFDTIAHVFLMAYAAAIVAVGLNALGRHLPLERKWLAALVGVLVIGGVVALVTFGLPVLLGQARDLAGRGPGLEEQIREWEVWLRQQTGANVRIPRPAQALQPGNVGGSGAVGSAMSLLESIFVPVIVFFGALFALANPNEHLMNPVLRLVRSDQRPAVYRVFQLLGERLVGWLRGTALAMLGVGLLSIALFSLIGVPNALLLGLLNGSLEFLPLVGPWIGGGTATLVAFLDDPGKAGWTALAALAIQQIEGYVITPMAMKRSVEIHPFITLFALVLFGGVFGFLGLLLALPLVILVWTLVQVLWVERALDTDRDRIAPVVKE